MEAPPTTRIVHDDEEIRVVWHPGQSAFVLITFDDSQCHAAAHGFFADAPARKAGIATLGVVAKRPNWYPRPNMLAARDAMLDLLAPYRLRIAYGGSMGGYAAIKFSRMLGATQVIALCPQWSIDSDECHGIDPGWQQHFVGGMAGMGIRRDDVAGAVFVFADDTDPTERFHRRRIAQAVGAVHGINVPLVGHHVTSIFAGTQNLLELIGGCIAADLPALYRFSRRHRRGSQVWRSAAVAAFIRRWPGQAGALIARQALHDPQILQSDPGYFLTGLRHLLRAGRTAEAMAFYDKCRDAAPDPIAQLQVCAYLGRATGRAVAIETTHRTLLLYRLDQRTCAHRPACPDDLHVPIRAELLGGSAALFVVLGATRFFLGVDDRRNLVIASDGATAGGRYPFQIAPATQGHFTLSFAGRHLSAEPDGRMVCDREAPDRWEQFQFGTIVAPPAGAAGED